jgi:hypothetical protein
VSAADEAFISTVAAAIAAVAGLIAVVVGSVNVVFARKLLTESRATITELRKLQEEGHGTIAELRTLSAAAEVETQAERATTMTLRMILTETQAARELELLGEIAADVYRVSGAALALGMSLSSTAPTGAWSEFQNAQRLLGAQLAALPMEGLETCNGLASPQADPRFDPLLAVRAGEEIRAAIEQARRRLVDTRAAADAQLNLLTQSL